MPIVWPPLGSGIYLVSRDRANLAPTSGEVRPREAGLYHLHVCIIKTGKFKIVNNVQVDDRLSI
jgi:hypothetical protein